MGSYWSFYGANTFGVTLIPMFLGVALLFWNGKSPTGWLLTVGGFLFILAGVIANMHIYFQPTNLFNTMVMLILLVGGLSLVAPPRYKRSVIERFRDKYGTNDMRKYYSDGLTKPLSRV